MDGVSHAQALVVVESGSATVNPASGWMVSRHDVKLQIARGGKAYAAMPLGANGVSCTQRVEVVTPDGTSCGATDYPIAAGIHRSDVLWNAWECVWNNRVAVGVEGVTLAAVYRLTGTVRYTRAA